jgi:hypothetical protein
MGWLFTCGMTRREMISERASNWERTTDDMVVKIQLRSSSPTSWTIFAGVGRWNPDRQVQRCRN